MDDDLKKVRKMTAFMRKQGLLKVKVDGIELELSHTALTHDLDEAAPASSLIQGEESDPANPRVPSEDEMRLGLPAGSLDLIDWSSPGALPNGAAS